MSQLTKIHILASVNSVSIKAFLFVPTEEYNNPKRHYLNMSKEEQDFLQQIVEDSNGHIEDAVRYAAFGGIY
jgi:hypothetical protein